MLDAYSQGLTAQEIVEQCETLAGSPGYHLNPTTGLAPTTPAEFKATPAYRQLRVVLNELYLQYEWPFLATGTNLAVAGRENTLPLDFWRVQFANPLILLDGSQRHMIHHLSPDQFFRHMRQTSGSARPTYWTIDKSRSSFYVDPIPDKGYLCEFHYYRRPNFDADDAPDKLTDPTDIVRMPHSELLIEKLMAWYYRVQDDARYPTAKQEAGEMLSRIRAASDDDRDAAAAIPLDPLIFSTPTYED